MHCAHDLTLPAVGFTFACGLFTPLRTVSTLQMRTERDEMTPVVLSRESRFLDARAAHRMLATHQDAIYGAAGASLPL